MRGLFGVGAPSGSIDAWHFIGEFRFRVFRAFSGILLVSFGFGYFGHFRGFGSRRGVSSDPKGTTKGDTFGGSWPRQPPGAHQPATRVMAGDGGLLLPLLLFAATTAAMLTGQ